MSDEQKNYYILDFIIKNTRGSGENEEVISEGVRSHYAILYKLENGQPVIIQDKFTEKELQDNLDTIVKGVRKLNNGRSKTKFSDFIGYRVKSE